MTRLEPSAVRASRSTRCQRPRIAGYRVADLSAAAGAAVWLGAVAGTIDGAVALDAPSVYVALAALVLVPLGLGLVDPPRAASAAAAPYRVAVLGQPPAAVALVVALAAPRASLVAVALTVPWLGVTGTIALWGVGRLASRGGGSLPDLAVDAGLLYVPVAAAFLCLHAAGVSLRFAPIIVLLTGVHFHYAGFVLPLVVGLVGRIPTANDGADPTSLAARARDATTAVVVAGIGLIAIGITFSPLVEAIAVAAFAIAVAGFAIRTLRTVVPVVPRLPGLCIAVAALSLCWTMALALAFGFGSLPGASPLVSIPEMVRWHGSVNAFGFALPALIALRLLEK